MTDYQIKLNKEKVLKNKAVKTYIQQIKQAGQNITANWDAGGDECCVDVLVDGKRIMRYSQDDPRVQLGDIIARELMLPSVGEISNSGSGLIDINKAGNVTITFSSTEAYYDYKSEPKIFELKDLHNIKKYLHRANISFWAELRRDNELTFNLNFNIQHGDRIVLEEEIIADYKKQYQYILDQYLEELEQTKDKKRRLENIYIRGNITEEMSNEIIVEKNYSINTICDNETKILID